MNYGFTGTQDGMTDSQLIAFIDWIGNATPSEFHHGQCVGADVQAALIAHEFSFTVIAHPGHPKDQPKSTYQRGIFLNNDVVLEAYPYLERNHHIVDASEIVLATPGQMQEVMRSGTWATIRYAQKSKPVVLFMPDGSIEYRGK